MNMGKKILFLGTVLYLGFVGVGVAAAQDSQSAQAADEMIAALQAQIDQLTQLVKSLETEVVKVSEPTKVEVSEPRIVPVFEVTLSAGMSGENVVALQEFLAAQPEIYPEGLVTGYFGSLTEKAVQRFQEKNGVVSGGETATTGYGVFGPKTREKAAAVVVSQSAPSGSVSGAGLSGEINNVSVVGTQDSTSGLSGSSSAVVAGSSALAVTENVISTTSTPLSGSVATNSAAAGTSTISQSVGSSLTTGGTSSAPTSSTASAQSTPSSSSTSSSPVISSTTSSASASQSTTSATVSSETTVATSTTSTSSTSSTSSTASEPTVTTSTSSTASTSSPTLPRVYFASANFVTGTTTEAEVTLAIENVTGMLGYRVGVQIASPAQYKNGSIERYNIGSGMGAENEGIYANGFLANWAVTYIFSGSTNMLKFKVTIPPGTSSIGLSFDSSRSRLNDGALPATFENTTLTIGGGAALMEGTNGLASVLSNLSVLLRNLSESIGR